MARIELVGVPMDCGKPRRGCVMGPEAYRVAGLADELANLGHDVTDTGDVAPAALSPVPEDAPDVYALAENIAWTRSLAEVAEAAVGRAMPIFMGGDHALSLGTVSGVAKAAAAVGRAQYVLWLDAHSDFHTLATSPSGNVHGTPLAYVAGRAGFPGFPMVSAPVPDEQIGLIGLRSVDGAERRALQASPCFAHDMRDIDEDGISAPLREFLARVKAANAALHVSLDVDFLDPAIAPAVGTTVPGGTTFREAHLVMEILSDAGLVTSLDLVELNPFLDERGRTASLMVDLTASLLGRRVFDRPTRAYV